MAKNARRYRHGDLDRMAAVILAHHPELTLTDIARALGCSARSLSNRRKYPLLARLTEMFGTRKWDYHPGLRGLRRPDDEDFDEES